VRVVVIDPGVGSRFDDGVACGWTIFASGIRKIAGRATVREKARLSLLLKES